MSIGTSLAEAYMPEEQIDPRNIFDYSTEPDGTYDPQDANRQSPYYKGGSTQIQSVPPTLPNKQSNIPTVSPPVDTIHVDSASNSDGGANSNSQNEAVVNPVREYPPYEYDANTLQQQLNQNNLQRQLNDLQQIKSIKQNRKKIENFSDESSSSSKKKGDVFKSILFTLMILLAISTHYFIAYVYEHFVTAPGQYSLRQEVGFRLIYPIIILGIIWWAKS